MSPFRNTDFGRMRPKFKCTVYGADQGNEKLHASLTHWVRNIANRIRKVYRIQSARTDWPR